VKVLIPAAPIKQAPAAPGIALALHDLAGFYEAHPWVPKPWGELSIYDLHSKEEAARVARAFGECEKDFSTEGLVALTKDFGGLRLRVVFNRDAVCERVVVGTKTVPRREVPAEVIEAHEEDIVEWRCGSVLEEVSK
jgi:hypothetical protein